MHNTRNFSPWSTASLSDEHALQLLEAEFKTIDPALIVPIYYDTGSIEAARDTLKILGGQIAVDDCNDPATFSPGSATSCPELGDWSSEAGLSTMSLTSLQIDDDENDDTNEMTCLRAMFPNMKRVTLEMTLERCQWNLQRAVDELLNRTFLDGDEEEGVVKGVDAFGPDINGVGGKRKRRQKKNGDRDAGRAGLGRSASVSSPGYVVGSVQSRWDKMGAEIQFIEDALGLPKATVSSAYHSNGSRLAPTVAHLLETLQRTHDSLEDDSNEHLAELAELAEVFGKDVDYRYLDALLRACNDNKAAVFKLADILSTHKSPIIDLANIPKSPVSPKKPISTPRHNDDENWVVVGTSLNYPAPSRSSRTTYSNAATSASFAATSASFAADHKTARNEAFNKAAESYRRSKSDWYMGGAAAYYADIGRDHDKRYKELSDTAAEQLVAENSNGFLVDLHGVTVQQAVKIARERTTTWWVECKSDVQGRGVRPLVIVTGMGRHSKDGNPKLFPAVKNMLEREKWRVSTQQGQIVVYGAK